MKQNLRYHLLLFFLSILVTSYGLKAQTSVFDPNDPVNKYDPNNPPVKPPNGQVGKWVRTVRVTWNTTDFKCYIYNGLPFRLKYPKNWDPTQKYPLLIFFHGRGEFGPTIYDNEYQLALGAQKHEGAVDDGSLINCFLLYPQVQQDYWASSNLSTVDQLVEKILIPQLKIDQFRIFVNGLSAGAGGVWDFMLRYTKLVAAATPISNASLAYIDSVDKYKFTPIYHFQGGLDTDPMPSTSRTLGSNILAAGGNYKYKEFPNLGHSCWNQAWAEPDYFPFYSKAHKANPWPLGGKTEFCKGDPINVVIGVTPGFDGYEWRKNGVLIGASTNQIVATDFGSYDCRVKSGTEWSVWSPVPVVIKLKAPTTQPQIKVTGMASNVIPAPDGSTSVPLEVPANYNSYNWQKEGSSTVLSTTPTLIANAAGDYKIHVTEDGGCPLSNYTTTSSFASIKIEAENYTGMYGVRTQTTGDAGGGLNVTYIDLDDWMDYNVNVTLAGVYNITLRVATIYSGGQFQVKDARGTILGSADIPNTTRSQTYVDVAVPINLASGAQTIRIQSSASPRWNFNYFTITGSNLLPANFSKPFKVVNANGTNGPAAISNLTAVTASMSSVELKWDQVASPAYNETAFEVYQAANNINGPYKLVVVTNADATGAVVNNLDQGVTYYYKVRAINDNAASTVSAAVSATTTADNTPPTAPASLHVGTITKSSVQLLWTASSDNVGVVRYDVYINGVKAYAAPVGTSYVVYNLLPSTSYNFSLKARDLAGNNSSFSNQVSATTLTGTVKIDPNQTPTSPDNHSVYLNFNLTNGAALPWNNMSTLPNAGITKKNMKNYSGDFSGISMTIVDNFSGYNGDGMITGNNSGVYPDNVMRSSYYCDKGVTAKIRIDGLSLMHKYSFVFFGSRNGGGDRTAIYSIGNKSVSLNASYNISQTVEIDNIIPDINGSVEIEITLGSVAQFAYLNSLVIKGYSSSVSDSTDTPPPPPPPPPPPAAGVVKVNVYGGVSPYSNSEWNNWNVSGSSNITSSSFKYSDGTSSLVSAELSSNRGINDNGTTYGGTMAPAEVLRYDSYQSSERTLTIKGLSTSQSYSLELYASRKSSGQSTIFTIGGVSKSVDTYYNLTDKAAFTGIVPNAQGQIIVNIKSGTTYNYLNGFVLTAGDSTDTPPPPPPPPPPPAAGVVKVNVYGGVSPYSNSEWNNWNVSGSSNITSSSFKYSDGTSSLVSAELSSNRGINDNGTTYGGTMAPAEVLRYDSYQSSERTLTIKGLSTSQSYSLELYASRKSSGQSTIFTIGGVSKSVDTYYNLTDKAAFTGIVPNAQGQIIVNIKSGTTYNYLNGFVLSPNDGTTLMQARGGMMQEEQTLTLSLQAYPNPTTGYFSLSISSSSKIPVDLQITDVVGRQVELRRGLSSNGVVRVGQFLKPGLYYAEAWQGDQKAVIKIIKK